METFFKLGAPSTFAAGLIALEIIIVLVVSAVIALLGTLVISMLASKIFESFF